MLERKENRLKMSKINEAWHCALCKYKQNWKTLKEPFGLHSSVLFSLFCTFFFFYFSPKHLGPISMGLEYESPSFDIWA